MAPHKPFENRRRPQERRPGESAECRQRLLQELHGTLANESLAESAATALISQLGAEQALRVVQENPSAVKMIIRALQPQRAAVFIRNGGANWTSRFAGQMREEGIRDSVSQLGGPLTRAIHIGGRERGSERVRGIVDAMKKDPAFADSFRLLAGRLGDQKAAELCNSLTPAEIMGNIVLLKKIGDRPTHQVVKIVRDSSFRKGLGL